MKDKHSRRLARVSVAMGAMLATVAAPVAADPQVTTVAEGFVSPLGLAIGTDGTMYVAEAFIGRLTAVDRHGEASTLHQSDGAFLAGVAAAGKGQVIFTETYFPEDHDAPQDEALLLRSTGRNVSAVASTWDYEQANNPDGDQWYGFLDLDEECRSQLPPFLQDPYQGILESNPYAVAIDGGSYLVADAAANAILRVSSNGKRIQTVAVLPPVPQVITEEMVEEFAEFGLELPECVIGETYTGEPVPTDVEVGPDGHYYVSTLPGAPEAPGTGAVYRIHRRTGEITMVADGFTGAVDLAVAKDGTIYVAELFASRISQIAPDGQVSVLVELPLPGAVEVAPGGTIYATAGVFFPEAFVVTISP